MKFITPIFKLAILIFGWLLILNLIYPAIIPPPVRVDEATQTRREMIRKIYFLESTSGKYDPCVVLVRSKYNGYGYAPGTCYDSPQTVYNIVDMWIKEKQELGWTDAQILCRYNLGGWHDDCGYYQLYLSL